MIFLPDFFAEVRKIEQELQDLLQQVHKGEDHAAGSPFAALVPPVDIIEQDDRLIILMDVPGIPLQNLHVQYSDGVLTITGRKPLPEAHREPVNFVCMERRFGTFRRKIYLRRPVVFEQSSATLTNGILKITLQTRAERRGAPITIPISSHNPSSSDKEGVE